MSRPFRVWDPCLFWGKPGCGNRALAPPLLRVRHLGNHLCPGISPRKRPCPALLAVAEHPVLIPGHLSAFEREELRNLAPLVRYFLIPTSLKAVSR